MWEVGVMVCTEQLGSIAELGILKLLLTETLNNLGFFSTYAYFQVTAGKTSMCSFASF